MGKFKLSADKLVDQNIDRIVDKLMDGEMNQCKVDTIKVKVYISNRAVKVVAALAYYSCSYNHMVPLYLLFS